MALGHIAVTGFPARTVARAVRARDARVVVSATERGTRWVVPSCPI